MPSNKSALLRYRVIDSCLRNTRHKYPTLDYILHKIEDQIGMQISESMFNKDVQAMKRHFSAPIKFDRQQKGYYYTEPDYSFAEFPLTHEEIEALDYSTALLHQLQGTRIFEQFENAINKVIIGYRVRNSLGKSESQILQVEEPVKTGGSEWLEILLKGIVEKTALKVAYQGFGKEEKVHLLSPYLVKEYRNRWYVAGFSNRAENVLIFALDRIRTIETTEEKYHSQEGFSPEEFFKYSFGITQLHDAKPEKVKLSFTAAQAPYILSQPLHHSQRPVDQSENELIIELETYITSELKMCILSFGAEVKVLGPEHLKKEIEETIVDMLTRYAEKRVVSSE